MKKLLGIILLVLMIGAGAWFYFEQKQQQPPQSEPQPTAEQPIATAHYQCDAGKTIDAQFYEGTTTPPSTPGQPPQPGGSVKVQLSDGRTMTLKQTISADGARYSDGDPQKQGAETFVFWSKGNGALVLENNEQKNYIGCIEVAKDPGGLPGVFESGAQAFSIRYPADYTVDDTYKYQALGTGKDIAGVKFTIASSTAAGTNLSPDTYLSIEEIPQASYCSASLFLDGGSKMSVSTTTIGGTEYSVATTTGAAAGNRYEESVYAISVTNPCIAVRYFIHYGVLANYPTGTVQQFDEAALRAQFDAMRGSLIFQQ